MKTLTSTLTSTILLAVATMGFAIAEDSGAKADIKDAGRSTKRAVKKTGSAAKKGTKKVVNKSAAGVEKAADKVKDKTE